jgi:hypothetical protein
LAAALVDANMLQALPEANLVINATQSLANNPTMAHLFTSLKAISDLGVDAVQVASGVNKVYIDLGLPADDQTAMADIQALLGSIDPANQAKLVHAGTAEKAFSLVMSGDLARTIIAAGGFNDADLVNMSKLGISEITLLDSANSLASTGGLFGAVTAPVAQTPVVPEVTIVGSAGPDAQQLSDDLTIKKL